MNRFLPVLLCALGSCLVYGQHTQLGSDIDGEASDDGGLMKIDLNNSGTIIAIGTPNNDDGGQLAGSVRVFENNTGNWVQLGSDIDGTMPSDRLGIDVALNNSGTIVAIGATGLDRVEIHEYVGGDWNESASIMSTGNGSEAFGFSVALNGAGTIFAVGAVTEDSPNGSASGVVRVYENIGGTWQQLGNNINGLVSSDRFGHSLSISDDGTVLAVGAPNNFEGGDDAGQVRVFENIAGLWTQVGANINGLIDWEFGDVVDLSADGTTLAIGGKYAEFNTNTDGIAKVYRRNGSTWSQLGEDFRSDAPFDKIGSSISLNGDGTVVAVGSENHDGGGPDAGKITLYTLVSNNWLKMSNDILGEDIVNWFGSDVVVNNLGTRDAGAATFNDNANGPDAGHARVYEVDPTLNITAFDRYSGIHLFPNAANTSMIIRNESGSNLKEARIYDLLGRQILIKSLLPTNSHQEVTILNLAKGTYIMVLTTGDTNFAKRFVRN